VKKSKNKPASREEMMALIGENYDRIRRATISSAKFSQMKEEAKKISSSTVEQKIIRVQKLIEVINCNSTA